MVLRPQVVLLLYCLVFCFHSVACAPITERQNGARTVTTVYVINTPNGPMTETCTIILTPIIDSAGTPAVREVENCNLKPGSPNGASSATVPPTAGSSSATSAPSLPNSAPSSSQPLTPSTPLPPSQTTSSSIPASSASDSTTAAPGLAPTPSTTGSITVHGVSSVPISAVPTPTTSPSALTSGTPTTTPTSASTPSTTGGINVHGVSSVPISAVPTPSSGVSTAVAAFSSPSSVASAAAVSETPIEKFQIPGRTLSVLPIGLGVFAGIAVIALIVVGLVTYERTKYRKAFRQRRLAETGANMGYGGTSQV
ncbi:hypothetical protein APHAL10511_004847 [Amanita phalloides]|nr:hypothetical protein APHAL10511_004847 [Amanita phalloides]